MHAIGARIWILPVDFLGWQIMKGTLPNAEHVRRPTDCKRLLSNAVTEISNQKLHACTDWGRAAYQKGLKVLALLLVPPAEDLSISFSWIQA
eukprot:s1080_g34.t1